jgi:hypothetical protein
VSYGQRFNLVRGFRRGLLWRKIYSFRLVPFVLLVALVASTVLLCFKELIRIVLQFVMGYHFAI